MATIGSKAWKHRGFRRIVEYINSDHGRMEKDTSFPAIYHNIPGSTLEDAISALRESSEKRKHKRKDAVAIFHEWISFHKDDRPSIAELEDLAHKWIELRSNGRDAVCFARGHLHSKALHVHFAFGGTALDGSALRLSNAEFLQIRQEHEAYQVQKYPHLTRSVVYLDKERLAMLGREESEKRKRGQRDFSRKKRLQESGKSEKSHKEQCRDLVLESLTGSKSFDGFEKAIQDKGLGLYRRGARLEGATYKKKKYRFRSLGLDVAMLRSIEKMRDGHEEYRRRVESLSGIRPKGLENQREK